MKRPISLTVTGTVRTAVVEPRSLLVHVLRDDFNLTARRALETALERAG